MYINSPWLSNGWCSLSPSISARCRLIVVSLPFGQNTKPKDDEPEAEAEGRRARSRETSWPEEPKPKDDEPEPDPRFDQDAGSVVREDAGPIKFAVNENETARLKKEENAHQSVGVKKTKTSRRVR